MNYLKPFSNACYCISRHYSKKTTKNLMNKINVIDYNIKKTGMNLDIEKARIYTLENQHKYVVRPELDKIDRKLDYINHRLGRIEKILQELE
mgnify:CR=1 FL=1